MFILGPVMSALTGGGAAAGAGAAASAGATAAAGAGAAASGISISSILQGVATVGGLAAAISAGNAQAEALEMQAADAEAEKPLENLQGISRRRSLKAAALEAVSEQDLAYASSGVDLSTGTAAQARRDAYGELDVGLTSDSGTSMTRLSRLTQRASSYRQMGKRARRMGLLQGLTGVASYGAQVLDRY